jgi:TPR repeat protein
MKWTIYPMGLRLASPLPFLLLLFSLPCLAQDSVKASTASKPDLPGLIKKAEAGDAASQNFLAMMYVSGDGVPKDFSKAMHWFSKSAEQGNAEGQYNLAVIYEKGEGVTPSCADAVKWYSKAAQQKFAPAIDNLIGMRKHGICLKQDDKEIATLTKQLAELGDAVAQLNLGTYFVMGRGVPQNEAEGGRWYALAAESGEPSAQFMLGQYYRDGRGNIEKNYVTAYKWFTVAVAGGNHLDGRNFLKNKMTPEEIATAERQAQEWIQAHSASQQ